MHAGQATEVFPVGQEHRPCAQKQPCSEGRSRGCAGRRRASQGRGVAAQNLTGWARWVLRAQTLCQPVGLVGSSYSPAGPATHGSRCVCEPVCVACSGDVCPCPCAGHPQGHPCPPQLLALDWGHSDDGVETLGPWASESRTTICLECLLGPGSARLQA